MRKKVTRKFPDLWYLPGGCSQVVGQLEQLEPEVLDSILIVAANFSLSSYLSPNTKRSTLSFIKKASITLSKVMVVTKSFIS